MQLFEAIVNQEVGDSILNKIEDLAYPDKILKLLEWNNWIFVFRNYPQSINCFIVNEHVDGEMCSQLDKGGFICHLEMDPVMNEAYEIDCETRREEMAKRSPAIIPVYGIYDGKLVCKNVEPEKLHKGSVLGLPEQDSFGGQLKRLQAFERHILEVR